MSGSLMAIVRSAAEARDTYSKPCSSAMNLHRVVFPT